MQQNGNFKFFCTFSILFIILFIIKGSRLVFLNQCGLYTDCLARFDLGSEGRRFEPGLCQFTMKANNSVVLR